MVLDPTAAQTLREFAGDRILPRWRADPGSAPRGGV